MRDDTWLEQRLEQIWQLLFPDVEKLNNILIKFKGKWKNKFGHIKKVKGSSEIAINALFKHDIVPEYIIDLTIAHELIHYWHGFNSPHQKRYKHPHAGGIVTRELKKRGFAHMMRLERSFVKNQWRQLYPLLRQK